MQRFAVFRPQHRAAARGQHDIVAPGQVGNHVRLAIAKARFAFQLEDHRDARARTHLDFMIGIEERAIETARNGPAHGGFACPHEPYKKYIGVCVPRLQRCPLANPVWFVPQLTGKAAALSSLRTVASERRQHAPNLSERRAA